MKPLSDMNKDERSLLLYFESSAVDYGGKIDARRMNAEDFALAKQWSEDGFVAFGRIAADDIFRGSRNVWDHWVVLSESAWELARQERRARNERIESKMDIRRIGLEERVAKLT